MTDKTKGFFWHIHHDKLMEWSDDINERIAYIKKEKPGKEQALRLKLMKPVKGKIPSRFIKAWESYDKARKAYDKAKEVRDKAWEALIKAREACDKAWEAYNKAVEASKEQIEALHRKECPNCPWNGKTIFTEKVKT